MNLQKECYTTSIFTGICGNCDSLLFKPIDDLFNINSETSGLFLLRTLFFSHHKEVSRLKLNENRHDSVIKGEHPPTFEFKKRLKNNKVYIKQFCKFMSFLQIKKKPLSQIFTFNNGKVSCWHMKINEPIGISSSSLHETDYAGIFFSLNIIPHEKHCIIIISFLKDHVNYMKPIKDLLTSNSSRYINYLAFERSENFYISEKLYNITLKTRKDTFEHLIKSKSTLYQDSFTEKHLEEGIIDFSHNSTSWVFDDSD